MKCGLFPGNYFLHEHFYNPVCAPSATIVEDSHTMMAFELAQGQAKKMSAVIKALDGIDSMILLIQINHTSPFSKYHTTFFKVSHHLLQSITSHSSKYHITLFKVPYHPLQSITSPFSKYHITIFKVSHHPLQSITSPSSKYHITIFKVSHPLFKHHPHQSII